MYYLRRKIFSINVITPLLVITATSIDYFTTTIHSAYGQAIQRSSDSNNTARDVSERYIAKSNPYIVMVSTPRYQGLITSDIQYLRNQAKEAINELCHVLA
jgi:hypothetical protein